MSTRKRKLKKLSECIHFATCKQFTYCTQTTHNLLYSYLEAATSAGDHLPLMCNSGIKQQTNTGLYALVVVASSSRVPGSASGSNVGVVVCSLGQVYSSLLSSSCSKVCSSSTASAALVALLMLARVSSLARLLSVSKSIAACHRSK